MNTTIIILLAALAAIVLVVALKPKPAAPNYTQALGSLATIIGAF